MKRKFKNNSGFTLIELLVALALFSIVITIAVGIFSSSMSGIWGAFGHQNIQDSARFVMESMSKEIRMSKINTADGGPYATINITNSKGETLDYTFAGGYLLRDGQPVSSGKVQMHGAFYVQKVGGLLPRATVIVKAQNISNKPAEQVKIYLETTISSREYNQ